MLRALRSLLPKSLTCRMDAAQVFHLTQGAQFGLVGGRADRVAKLLHHVRRTID
jgi:hypothetical protein